MTRVAVDLTPLMPDGSNGGAKLVATELVRHLSQSAGDVQFILLTSQHSHELLVFSRFRKCPPDLHQEDHVFRCRIKFFPQESIGRLGEVDFGCHLLRLDKKESILHI